MKDDFRQPSEFDSLSHSEQDRLRAVRDLGSFTQREYNVRFEKVEDRQFLGSLNRTDSDKQPSVLFASTHASPAEQGYLYLRGLSALSLRHLDEVDDVSFPFPDKSRYRHFSVLEKMMSLEGITATQHILIGKPPYLWEDSLLEQLNKAGSDERLITEARLNRLIVLLQQPRFQGYITEWQRLLESDMDLLQASIRDLLH